MITKVRIQNYRSIRDETVELRKLNVVFGKNGAGKTNFISAFHLLKSLVGGNDLDTVVTGKIAPFTGELFYFKDHKTTATFEFTIEGKDSKHFIFSYAIGISKYAGVHRLAVQSESLKKMDGTNSISIYKRERDLTYAGSGLSQVPFKVELNKLMLSSYSNEDVAEVVKIIDSYTFIDTFFEGRDGLTFVQGNKPNLNTLDGVAVSLFIKNGGRFAKAVTSIKKVIPNFVEPIVLSLDEREAPNSNIKKQGEEIKRYFVTWREEHVEGRFSNLSLSHGDRRVIHLFFSLFNADEYSFFTVEEIENGMHLGRLMRQR